MTVKELKKNNMAFKMKGSPVKNLAEFFKGLGKEGTKKRQKKQVRENQGMTNFEKRRAQQKRMSRGESEFQYKNRMRREASAEAKKSIVPGSFSTKRKLEGDLVVNQDLMSKKISKPKKSNKIDWTKVPKVGTKARTEWYMKNNLALDDTTPGYKENVNPEDFEIIEGKYGPVSTIPIQKKSPYKKGIGKYAKKAKGSRGYKMKRK